MNLQTTDYCNTELYGEEHTMCKYTADAPNARCTEGEVEIISRKVTDQVTSIMDIHKCCIIREKTSNKIKLADYEYITD